MKSLLKRIVVIIVLAGAGYYLWSNRDHIGSLVNPNVSIQGKWHRVSQNFKEPEVYTFADGFIGKGTQEWATYKLIRGSKIEVSVRNQASVYELEFPDDENMIWTLRNNGRTKTQIQWRR